MVVAVLVVKVGTRAGVVGVVKETGSPLGLGFRDWSCGRGGGGK